MKQSSCLRICTIVGFALSSAAAAHAFGFGNLKGAADQSTHPGSDQMAEILGADLTYHIFGTGGIKVSMPHLPGRVITAGDTYDLYIDGSALSGGAGGLTPINVSSDFTAAPGRSYFVSARATCSMPPATSAAGKEILVCNKVGEPITYITPAGETISGQPSGTLTNPTKFKVDRFISDGTGWYKE